ncbi:YbaB/EbfC family nucleoid-associated protein [Sulfurimonas sp. HSL-1716]|uniref:YbaB/EbfC family nucleoid-associated protein n=1 Tax=Hydrocurvibacter sulfurireducens TaxID=3131937 RepID=UPI0031F8B35C
MFENMGDMAKMLSSMQEQAKQFEAELDSKTFTVKTGGGMVEIVANGKGEVIDLLIDDSLLEDKEALQILLIGAYNDLLKMVEQNKQNSAMGMLGGINPFGSK